MTAGPPADGMPAEATPRGSVNAGPPADGTAEAAPPPLLHPRATGMSRPRVNHLRPGPGGR